MPIPANIRNRLLALAETAYDAWLAGQESNLAEHFIIGGEMVKVRVYSDPDHPKEVVISIKWKRRRDEPPHIS